MRYKILSSTFSPQGIYHFGLSITYLNDCVILGKYVSNRVAAYWIIQEFSVSPLYNSSN